MKINGRVISGPYTDVLVLPRGSNESIIFKIQAILDDKDFEKILPRPNPPYISEPGKEPYRNFEDETFKAAINKWAEQKNHWLNIKSLSATDGLEWDTVKLSDPNTWKNWTDDLKNAGISEMEIIYLIRMIQQVNGLDQEKIEEAKKRFLAGQAATSKGN